ncbi:hypothetical protein BU24DRAFT_451583 [Aaosphaeria arxii CBS 175.79]|uniref:Zn(2)-C6 fungal-type domain-containing protein n=1 Tax=Aaosphaeria arxii CBS 175.79 TaxID=1450172 RepID=A0A6A5XN75_9PLEO|nr:uncharacterized protein BU24DRAFT_451583 [Aaosphaeria arxii CBS 175.79]KAF2014582.1 hypothetical protein BU24DRAFT_451583 [Aaosphaeria arxii CBS 175.79]
MSDKPTNQRRQCWACFKRRIVCDFGLPACKKCQNAGMECPGYDEKKPLKWLEPGRVTSKTRTKRKIPIEPGKKVPGGKKKNPRDDEEILKEPPPGAGTTLVYRGTKSSAKVESLLLKGKVSEAIQYVTDMGFLCADIEFVPRNKFRDVTSEVVDAVKFYNDRLFPHMLEVFQMAPSPHVIQFPLSALHHLPLAINHTLVGFALGYRMHCNELPHAEVWSKVYHHRGLAIRNLSDIINRCELTKKIESRKQKILLDTTIASILVFLCGELQQCASLNWRYHIDGMSRLIQLRGGITTCWHESPHARSAILMFIMIGVFANATSPADDHMEIAPHLELLKLLDEMYDDLFSYCLCPGPLFQDVVCINHLRAQVAAGATSTTSGQLVALELLMRVDSFSPVKWAKERDGFHEEFTILGSLWQAAVILYCISSLQQHSLLHPTPQLQAMRASYGDSIYGLISQAVENPRTKYFIAWPLVVAGVEAADRGVVTQGWVDERLGEVSRYTGTSAPLLARAAMRRFWKSEQKEWEDCFNKPFAFVV